MTTTDTERERKRENARVAIEDAVYRALEAGLTHQQIKEEVAYTLENAEEL